MPTVAKGFHLDPILPPNFDNTPNQSRPMSHSNWWGIPFIVTRKNEEGGVVSYDVRRLDGGAWDRSTSLGYAETLDAAVSRCREAAEDPMFVCPYCQATTLDRYSGPMHTLEDKKTFLVKICPVCSGIVSKEPVAI